MREIIFRGKRIDNGEWVEGYYYKTREGNTRIHSPHTVFKQHFTVLLETVGQYTGLEDKNGKKIFEGDIVTHFSNYLAKRINKAVMFEDGSFMSGEAFLIDWVECGGVNVIGSIHDNPELLK